MTSGLSIAAVAGKSASGRFQVNCHQSIWLNLSRALWANSSRFGSNAIAPTTSPSIVITTMAPSDRVQKCLRWRRHDEATAKLAADTHTIAALCTEPLIMASPKNNPLKPVKRQSYPLSSSAACHSPQQTQGSSIKPPVMCSYSKYWNIELFSPYTSAPNTAAPQRRRNEPSSASMPVIAMNNCAENVRIEATRGGASHNDSVVSPNNLITPSPASG